MVTVTSALSAFFDGVMPVLQGTTDPSALGGASEQDGLAFHQRLTGVELRRYLEQACPGVAIALEQAERGSFAALARDYLRAHPPAGWDPGAIGAHLGGFLRGSPDPRRAAPHLAEIAEIHALLRAAALAEDRAGDTFEQTLFVRRYETDSPRFVRCVLDGAPTTLPVATPTVALIFRSCHTQRAHLMVPSAQLLRALLAEARGEPGDTGARAELMCLGVLPGSVERPA
jgi:hypothetical protein